MTTGQLLHSQASAATRSKQENSLPAGGYELALVLLHFGQFGLNLGQVLCKGSRLIVFGVLKAVEVLRFLQNLSSTTQASDKAGAVIAALSSSLNLQITPARHCICKACIPVAVQRSKARQQALREVNQQVSHQHRASQTLVASLGSRAAGSRCLQLLLTAVRPIKFTQVEQRVEASSCVTDQLGSSTAFLVNGFVSCVLLKQLPVVRSAGSQPLTPSTGHRSPPEVLHATSDRPGRGRVHKPTKSAQEISSLAVPASRSCFERKRWTVSQSACADRRKTLPSRGTAGMY